MATTFPVTIPAQGARRVRIRQRSVVAVGQSPFTLEQQVQRHQGQCWVLEVDYPPLSRDSAESLIAALTSLNGREGTFLFGDLANPTPRGAATGTPLVNGASQSGEDLATDGWSAGVTAILKAGDWIQLGTGSNSRLHKLLSDSNSNGSGQATLALWPRISPVATPADNSAVVTSSPKGVFRLLSDGQGWDLELARIYGLSISAESLP
jgi:hypothetical protein